MSDLMRRSVVVSGLASDAHTWNLVFLQLLIEECGVEVANLGPCVHPELLVSECLERRPLMIVLSSVNGHGYRDALRAIDSVRACSALAETPVVVGGKLGVSGAKRGERAMRLLAAGYDAVYDDGVDNSESFRSLVSWLATGESVES